MPVEYHAHDFEFEDWRREVEQRTAERGCRERSESEGRDAPAACSWDRTSHKQAEAWEAFYGMHRGGDFFKERRYLPVEFQELAAHDAAASPIAVLELGCGNGSSVLPVLRANATAVVYACDFSESAVCLMEANVAAALPSCSERCVGFVCDVASQKMDYVLLVFVLSAVCPSRAATFLRNASAPLRPGGRVLFRDYGLYDMTMLRFPDSQVIDAQQRLYVRQDGTLSRILTKQDMQTLCADVGLTLLECEYHTVQITNRKKGLVMRRVFLHAKLEKPQ